VLILKGEYMYIPPLTTMQSDVSTMMHCTSSSLSLYLSSFLHTPTSSLFADISPSHSMITRLLACYVAIKLPLIIVGVWTYVISLFWERLIINGEDAGRYTMYLVERLEGSSPSEYLEIYALAVFDLFWLLFHWLWMTMVESDKLCNSWYLFFVRRVLSLLPSSIREWISSDVPNGLSIGEWGVCFACVARMICLVCMVIFRAIIEESFVPSSSYCILYLPFLI